MAADEVEQLTFDMLRNAGYDVDGGEHVAFGLLAITSAVRVFEVLERAQRAPALVRSVGRNDPCPCGSGRKYKKCCAGKGFGSTSWGILLPENPRDLVPVNPFAETCRDLTTLAELLREDPDLKRVRFPIPLVEEFLEGEEPADPEAGDARIDQAVERYLWTIEDPVLAWDLNLLFEEAAPRWSRDVDALRALALGAAFTRLDEIFGEEGEDDEAEDPERPPNLLYRMLYDLSAMEWCAPGVAVAAAVREAGGEEAFRRRVATGNPAVPGSLPKPFAPQPDLLPAFDEGRRWTETLAQGIRDGKLPEGLPLESCLPLIARLEAEVAEAPVAEDRLRELMAFSVRELGAEDVDVFDRLLGDWIDRHGQTADEETLVFLGTLRTALLGAGTTGALGPALLGWSLRHPLCAAFPGVPAPPEGSGDLRNALTPSFLERYGEFLYEKGFPAMAFRVWRLCPLFGHLSPHIRRKMAEPLPGAARR